MSGLPDAAARSCPAAPARRDTGISADRAKNRCGRQTAWFPRSPPADRETAAPFRGPASDSVRHWLQAVCRWRRWWSFRECRSAHPAADGARDGDTAPRWSPAAARARSAAMRCSRARRRLSSPRYSRLAASHTPSARLRSQLVQKLERLSRLEAMRQRQNQQLAFGKFQQVVEIEMTFALFGLVGIVAALAAGQQLAEPAVSGAVARIDQDIRRAVDEDEARTDQQVSAWCLTLGVFQFLVGPHHAGQRVVIGDADGGKPQLAGLMHILLRMRAAAQEREIRGDSDLGIAMPSGSSCEQPMHEPVRLKRSRPRAARFRGHTGRRDKARTAGRLRPRRGNNRASAFLLRSPPLHGDALRALDAHHRVGRAPPVKPRRRSVRHFRDHLDRLGPLEQPQRPQRRFAFHPLPARPLAAAAR